MADGDITNNGKDSGPAVPPAASASGHDSLPVVDSPSISPTYDGETVEAANDGEASPATAGTEAAPDANSGQAAADTSPATSAATLPAVIVAANAGAKARPDFTFPNWPNMSLTRRHKRMLARAAVIAVAAALGAVMGVVGTYASLPQQPKQEVASVEERQAMQHSIARLAKDVASLKTSIDGVSKATTTQIGKFTDKINEKISERLAKADRSDRGGDITGSISAPASTAAPRDAALPLPPPRPQIVKGWHVYDSGDGYVLAEQDGGDLYRIAVGLPLPGLGPIESIRRDNGQLEVVTARGIIPAAPRRTVRNRFRTPPFFDQY